MAEHDDKPILLVDVDGVISLFGFESIADSPGPYQWIDGVAHCIKLESGPLLERLAERFELVWATGWEEKANEYLPHLLGLSGEYPVLSFDGRAVFGSAHWKLEAIDEHARDRPAAWIDDNLDEECEQWAAERIARSAPTLLVRTETTTGISEEHVATLIAWADELATVAGS